MPATMPLARAVMTVPSLPAGATTSADGEDGDHERTDGQAQDQQHQDHGQRGPGQQQQHGEAGHQRGADQPAGVHREALRPVGDRQGGRGRAQPHHRVQQPGQLGRWQSWRRRNSARSGWSRRMCPCRPWPAPAARRRQRPAHPLPGRQWRSGAVSPAAAGCRGARRRHGAPRGACGCTAKAGTRVMVSAAARASGSQGAKRLARIPTSAGPRTKVSSSAVLS